MARSSGGLIDLFLLGGVGYGLYALSLNGLLGGMMQEMAVDIAETITGERPDIKFRPCGGPFGEIVPMIEANSSFAGQILTFQTNRKQEGRNPFNWRDFRVWLTTNGFPDPGQYPPSVFCRETP